MSGDFCPGRSSIRHGAQSDGLHQVIKGTVELTLSTLFVFSIGYNLAHGLADISFFRKLTVIYSKNTL